MSALAVDAATATYTDVEKLIYKLIHKFIRRYGGDFEELKSVANYAFVQAYDEWDSKKSSFSTTVSWYVNMHLLNELRDRIKRSSRVQYKNITGRDANYRQRHFANLLDTLSDDAKEVAKLVIKAPAELIDAMDYGELTPKKALRNYLLGLQWSKSRIVQSFNEIREALSA